MTKEGDNKVIELKTDGNVVTIDVREQIRRGEHPRGEIIQAVREAKPGTVFDIHVPHRTQPLIQELEALGLNVLVKELDMRHFRLMVAKL